jgi:hypothetical protein
LTVRQSAGVEMVELVAHTIQPTAAGGEPSSHYFSDCFLGGLRAGELRG